MMVRFATVCDVPGCGVRSEEYTAWPFCRRCLRDVCWFHQRPGSVMHDEMQNSCCCVKCDEDDDSDARLGICTCACGCDEPATRIGMGIDAYCDACDNHMVIDGEPICSREADGSTCHICLTRIDWGRIHTGQPGVSNTRAGDCECGPASWLDEDRGGWGHYSYTPPSRQR